MLGDGEARAPQAAMLFDRAIAAIAVAKCVLGVAVIVLAARDGIMVVPPQQWLRVAHVSTYAACGLLLLVWGRRDPRAQLLGTGLLLVGTLIADSLVRVHPAEAWPVTRAEQVMALQVDAFLPYFLWRFTRAFSGSPPLVARERLLVWATGASLCVGAALFAANAAFALGAGMHPGVASWLRWLSRWPRRELYWPLQLTLSLLALVTLLARMRAGTPDERRRGGLLVAGIAIGTAPALCWGILRAVWPAFSDLLPVRRAGWVIYPTLLSMPFTIAYAVLVRHALDVRLVIRRAVQYALARYTVIAAATVPLVLLVVLAYRRRDATVAELVTSGEGVGLALVSASGLFVLRRRRGLLDRIDRRFFRRQYDARATLTLLVDGCRGAATREELAHVLRAEIDRALQLECIAVLFLEPPGARYVAPDGGVRPLERGSALVHQLGVTGALVVGEAGDVAGPLGRALSADDRYWLLDGGFRLLLAIRGPDRLPAGVLALGPKKSELPFSSEDRLLLTAVAAAAELALGTHRLRATVPPDEDTSAPVAECRACGHLQHDSPDGDLGRPCSRCGGALAVCALPRQLGRKLRIEARVGAGGMGVVYRGVDLDLGRPVALKTLPQIGAGAALRLRREARAMALVSHPNLASIHGVESWYGRPILICEFLAGGTLADRVANGPMPPDEVVGIGVAVADALQAIHAAGLLHRDIKPSNIGFTSDRRPKLLDFGLARVLDTAAAHHAIVGPADERSTAGTPGTGSRSLALTGGTQSVLLGTPPYMSPEALSGGPADTALDLWGLAVALFEAVAGRHPFARPDGSVDYRRILTGEVPDARVAAPGVGDGLAAFLRTALAPDPGARHESAGAFARALGEAARVRP